MKRHKTNRRHILLMYKRMMDRLWGSTLALGILMLVLWFWSDFFFPSLPILYTLILLGGAIFVLAFTVFAFLARKMAYVQVYPDHLRVVTPFLRLKASYRRLRATHPSEFFRLFSPPKSDWALDHFLEPFYKQTALVVEFNQYPMDPRFLRLFLLPQMFSPQTNGLVFLVQDWMGLSTEIDSALSTFRQAQSESLRPRPGGFGLSR